MILSSVDKTLDRTLDRSNESRLGIVQIDRDAEKPSDALDGIATQRFHRWC